MADLQQLPPGLQRRQLLELIEESQATAWRKLLAAGVPEAHALAVIPRIRSCCMYCLNEYDQLILDFEEVMEREGRSRDHQKRINDKIGFLLHSMEVTIADVLAITIHQAIEAAKHPPPQNVISPPVILEPASPAWPTFLLNTVKLLIWLLGLPASFLLAGEFTAADGWPLLAPLVLFVLFLLFRFSWWGLIFPVTVLGTVLLLYSIPAS
jgi:hypothetical protein